MRRLIYAYGTFDSWEFGLYRKGSKLKVFVVDGGMTVKMIYT